MNILILTKSFPESPDDWGGSFVREQARALSVANNVLVVKCKVNYDRFSPFFHYTITENNYDSFNYCTVEVFRSFPVYNQFNYIYSLYLAVSEVLKERKIDLIHCHYSYPAGVVARLVKKRYRIPYVITEHTKISTTFRSVFHKKLSLWAMRGAFRVIAVSNSLKREILDTGIKNTDVVPNVIDTGRFSQASLSSSTFTIGFLGNLKNNNKGLDLLIEACAGLKFDFRLKIGGEGKLIGMYRESVNNMDIDDKAVFTGNVNPTEIDAFYSGINLFVLPSRYETFGVVLVEAMSCGIPVIAAKCGGPEDIVTPLTGLLVNNEDADQIREAIEYIYYNRVKYDPLTIREYARTAFGPETFRNKMNIIYSDALI